jgi:hypothetical protein
MSTLALEALIDPRSEKEILDKIVDAMLESRAELAAATSEQFDEILRDACRAQKWQPIA